MILMRHGERESAETDSPLSPAGVARANELARVLRDANVSAIYTTPFKRTEDTVAPLASHFGIRPIVMKGAAKTYAVDVVADIRERHLGDTVVVVGHSNTTPETIRALGVADPPVIPDSQYDDLFVVTIGDGGAPQLLKLKYGAPCR